MTAMDFEAWVELHCEATAASAEAAVALLANRAIFLNSWQASYAELSECTSRLIAKRRVPKFANEHSDAIGNELHHLRLERTAEARPDHSKAFYVAPRCDLCHGTGFVSVPHPECVCQPSHSAPSLRFYPGTKRVVTVAVLCDRPECVPGRTAREKEIHRKHPRPTLSRYLARFGGLDVLSMLREHERGELAAVKRRPATTPPAFAEVFARLKARVEQQGEAA